MRAVVRVDVRVVAKVAWSSSSKQLPLSCGRLVDTGVSCPASALARRYHPASQSTSVHSLFDGSQQMRVNLNVH